MQQEQVVSTDYKKPVLEESYQKIYQIVRQAEKTFLDQHGEQLNLTNPEHFVRLGRIINFEAHVKGLCDENNRPPYITDDLAQVFIKEFIKRVAHLEMSDEQKTTFIEAIFGQLSYNIPSRAIQSQIRELESLSTVVKEENLDQALLILQKFTQAISEAANTAFTRDNTAYNNLIGPCFHEITCSYQPPVFCLDAGPKNIGAVVAVLQRWVNIMDMEAGPFYS